VATIDRLVAANVRAAYFLVAALARPAQPGEIASVIAFFASPKASYITGDHRRRRRPHRHLTPAPGRERRRIPAAIPSGT
jgi:hypothetical protein